MEDQIKQLWGLMTSIHQSLSHRYETITRHEKYIEELRQLADKNKKIILNVGGHRFETTRETLLCERAQDSMLFPIGLGSFAEWGEQEDEEVFIDRDGTLFGAILHWLRGSESVHDVLLHSCDYLWSSKPELHLEAELEWLDREASYYGLQGLEREAHATLVRSKLSAPCGIGLETCTQDLYERVSPNRLRLVKENPNLWVNALTHVVFVGFKCEFEVHFHASDDFSTTLFDSYNTKLVRWNTREPTMAGLVDASGGHVVTMLIDWTQPDPKKKGNCLLNVTATLDGVSWPVSEDVTPDWGSRADLFVCAYIGTYTVGSEMSLERVSSTSVESAILNDNPTSLDSSCCQVSDLVKAAQ